MTGTAMMARALAVTPPAGQASLRRARARSVSVSGTSSSRVSLVKMANIDLSRGSPPSSAFSILSRTRCSLTGKLTPGHFPGKARQNRRAR